MSKSFFQDLTDLSSADSAPLPLHDGVVSNSDSRSSFVNPFVSSFESGQNYALFEQLPGLLEPNQKKTMVEELLSNNEILFYLLDTDPKATLYHIDLLKGKFNGHTIGVVEKHRVMAILAKHIPRKTKELFVFLEQHIGMEIDSKADSLIRSQSIELLQKIVSDIFGALNVLTYRNLARHDFMRIDDSSSLRRLMYLWNLVAFFATPVDRNLALLNLRNSLKDFAIDI